MIDQVIAKASVLIEALPYIQKFRDKMIVVKFGGSAMDNPDRYDGILTDVVFMECVGMLPIIVHGGGKAISSRLKERGGQATFIDGLRVTDEETVKVVEDVLLNDVNVGIVKSINEFGGKAVSIHGPDIFKVHKKTVIDPDTGETKDWGFVGEFGEVDIEPITRVINQQAVPVITPLGRGVDDGQLYNINADEAAVAVAKALKARKLAFLSDIPGLLSDPEDEDTLVSTVKISEVPSLVDTKVIQGGMLPKINSCVEALQAGVTKVHIIDGRVTHSLLLEIFTNKGVGTEIVHDERA
jgi:acetylglutamate kinase